MEVKNHLNNTLATAKRWPRPFKRGGRSIEVSSAGDILTNKSGLWKVAALWRVAA